MIIIFSLLAPIKKSTEGDGSRDWDRSLGHWLWEINLLRYYLIQAHNIPMPRYIVLPPRNIADGENAETESVRSR